MDSLDARRYTPIMSERTQRRLAAIVSADVVGYSRLIGADEVGTLAALRTHRTEMIDPLIANFGGRIVKTMGDGLLLEFPSVVDATDCALEFQKGMASRNADVTMSPPDGALVGRLPTRRRRNRPMGDGRAWFRWAPTTVRQPANEGAVRR